MESREYAPPREEPQSVEEAVARFIGGDTAAAVSFLRANREDVGEFCLQIRDRYSQNDTTTPLLELARLIESLL